jgi:hypothetical protein
MVSINSNDRYKFIDVLRSMRSLIDQLLETVNRFQLDESRKLVRSLNHLEKRTTLPQLKLAIVGDSHESKDKLLYSLVCANLQGLALPAREITCLYLAFGSEPECAVTLTNGMTARLPIAELPEFVGSQASFAAFKKFTVRIPNEVLRAGVIVIDTPTLLEKELAPCTRTALEEADACLLVVKNSDELSTSVVPFLREARIHFQKFFVVLDSPSQQGESNLVRKIQELTGIPDARMVAVPLCELPSNEDYSGKDLLESLRSGIMQFARVSSHQAMADELNKLAQETLDHATKAASSAKTLIQRMKLRNALKLVDRICHRTEELLAQTTAELSKTIESKPLIRSGEMASERRETSPEALAMLTETGSASVESASVEQSASVEPAIVLDSLLNAEPSVISAVHEPPREAPAPNWQRNLRRAANESPGLVTSTAPSGLHIAFPEGVAPMGSFGRTGLTRGTGAAFTRESSTSGATLTLPPAASKHTFPATVSATPSEAPRTETATALEVIPPAYAKTEPPETAREVSAEMEEVRSTSPFSVPVVEQVPSVAVTLNTRSEIETQRPDPRDEVLPRTVHSSLSESSRQVNDRLGAWPDVSDSYEGRRNRLIWRVAAIAAVAASAWAVMLGLEHRPSFEESAGLKPGSLVQPRVINDPHGVTNSLLNDKSSRKTSTIPQAPLSSLPVAGTSLEGVAHPPKETSPKEESPKETSQGSGAALGTASPAPTLAVSGERTERTTQPPAAGQVAHASSLNRGDTISDPSLRATLDRWANSYRNGNVQEQVSCYAPFVDTYFNLRNVRPQQVALDRQNTWSKIASVQTYRVTPIRITDQGNGQQSVLLQKDWDTTTTRGASFSGSDLEMLVFVKIDDVWKIVDEQEVKILKSKRG